MVRRNQFDCILSLEDTEVVSLNRSYLKKKRTRLNNKGETCFKINFY